jgi:hypothetical protein
VVAFAELMLWTAPPPGTGVPWMWPLGVDFRFWHEPDQPGQSSDVRS